MVPFYQDARSIDSVVIGCLLPPVLNSLCVGYVPGITRNLEPLKYDIITAEFQRRTMINGKFTTSSG